jgi:pyrroline-5-carboxylate reductase
VSPSSPAIALIGVGNMGSALVRGFLRDRSVARMVVYDREQARVDSLVGALADDAGRVVPVASVQEAVRDAEVILLSVKPGDVPAALQAVGAGLGDGRSVVSTAAGVTLERLRADLEAPCALFRVMPNLAVAYGEGVVALAPEEGTPPEAVARVEHLLAVLGLVKVLSEHHFDAATALTGSGPGFLALVLEGLEDGGVQAGLPRDVARAFVQQTALGAALLLREESLSAATLKDRVSSPGGTTIAGLAILEDRGVRGALLRAVQAATERCRQL